MEWTEGPEREQWDYFNVLQRSMKTNVVVSIIYWIFIYALSSIYGQIFSLGNSWGNWLADSVKPYLSQPQE